MNIQYVRRIVLIALLLSSGHAALLAQTQTIFARVRSAMEAQEVEWTLDKTRQRDDEFSQRWVNRAEDIGIIFRQLASQAAATDWLAAKPMTISVGGGRPVAGVGDAALMWGRTASSGSGAALYFRKGSAVVQVSAPSETIAIRIGQVVAAQIY
jgi:hypothetical protein